MEFTCLAIRSYKFTQIYSFLHDILRWFCLLSVHIIYCEVGFIMRIWYDLFLFLRSWEMLIFTFESWYHKRRWIHLVFHVWNTALKEYNILYTSSASCILYTRWAHETMFRYGLCDFKLNIFWIISFLSVQEYYIFLMPYPQRVWMYSLDLWGVFQTFRWFWTSFYMSYLVVSIYAIVLIKASICLI